MAINKADVSSIITLHQELGSKLQSLSDKADEVTGTPGAPGEAKKYTEEEFQQALKQGIANENTVLNDKVSALHAQVEELSQRLQNEKVSGLDQIIADFDESIASEDVTEKAYKEKLQKRRESLISEPVPPAILPVDTVPVVSPVVPPVEQVPNPEASVN